MINRYLYIFADPPSFLPCPERVQYILPTDIIKLIGENLPVLWESINPLMKLLDRSMNGKGMPILSLPISLLLIF